MPRHRQLIRHPLLSCLLLLSALGCDGRMPPFDPPGARGDGGPGDTGAVWPDQSIPRSDVSALECTRHEDCEGICVAGSCCASADRVCGTACCGEGEHCFANVCVKPGEECRSSGDCPTGQYCEPAIGEGTKQEEFKDDPPAGAACTQPLPIPGRCLPLPPVCPDGKDGDGCLPKCEVHPERGKIDAVEQWSWGAANASRFKDYVDVWSTPVVGRVTDSNCDGRVDRLDPPNILFVAGNAKGTCCQCTKEEFSACHTGVLRVLDGVSGKEIWSLARAHSGSKGFMGISLAIADIDRDGGMEIAAVTGEGYLVLLDRTGKLLRKSDKPIPGADNAGFGWGGGLSIGDMNGDGAPEIAYGATVFTTAGGKLTHLFNGTLGNGGGLTRSLSLMADVDGDGTQELVVGNAVYKYDGSVLWTEKGRADGFPAIGDFDGDGRPEIVLVAGGKVSIVSGSHGALVAGPLALPGTGFGGPPTVADFDGDGKPEIGVAKDLYYTVIDVDFSKPVAGRLKVLWSQANHDLSSSTTGSTVFDFEGDGRAEVIYNDECFLWVYDGLTGEVLFATPTTSFTATEASLVADVDGDGRAEMVMIANRASPAAWKCTLDPWNKPDPKLNRPAWVPPLGQEAYSGVTVWGGRDNSWVGTRTLWNQHTYHVSNICDERDGACSAADNRYGVVPRLERPNWQLPWLNNYRQNVQDSGLFDAPDATVSLRVDCKLPLTIRASVLNKGRALLPKGVEVGIYRQEGQQRRLLTKLHTTNPIYPGQAFELSFQPTPSDKVADGDTFVALIELKQNARFRECRTDNNISLPARNNCLVQ